MLSSVYAVCGIVLNTVNISVKGIYAVIMCNLKLYISYAGVSGRKETDFYNSVLHIGVYLNGNLKVVSETEIYCSPFQQADILP